MFGYRTGAKQNHINEIRERVLQGEGAEQISRALMIELKCIQNFVKHFKQQNEPKQKPEVQTNEVHAETQETELVLESDAPDESKPRRRGVKRKNKTEEPAHD